MVERHKLKRNYDKEYDPDRVLAEQPEKINEEWRNYEQLHVDSDVPGMVEALKSKFSLITRDPNRNTTHAEKIFHAVVDEKKICPPSRVTNFDFSVHTIEQWSISDELRERIPEEQHEKSNERKVSQASTGVHL